MFFLTVPLLACFSCEGIWLVRSFNLEVAMGFQVVRYFSSLGNGLQDGKETFSNSIKAEELGHGGVSPEVTEIYHFESDLSLAKLEHNRRSQVR